MEAAVWSKDAGSAASAVAHARADKSKAGGAVELPANDESLRAPVPTPVTDPHQCTLPCASSLADIEQRGEVAYGARLRAGSATPHVAAVAPPLAQATWRAVAMSVVAGPKGWLLTQRSALKADGSPRKFGSHWELGVGGSVEKHSGAKCAFSQGVTSASVAERNRAA